jgi:hypothetical protein
MKEVGLTNPGGSGLSVCLEDAEKAVGLVGQT